ncbi:hypothetical protein ACIBAG_28110 [Streptomyces sp. NPDC051243]|uniref:hypothetical protein n=1 Tax=Streptomyces sp. NPDC051243 TaxID=3365646 RepID=UPI00378AB003
MPAGRRGSRFRFTGKRRGSRVETAFEIIEGTPGSSNALADQLRIRRAGTRGLRRILVAPLQSAGLVK